MMVFSEKMVRERGILIKCDISDDMLGQLETAKLVFLIFKLYGVFIGRDLGNSLLVLW